MRVVKSKKRSRKAIGRKSPTRVVKSKTKKIKVQFDGTVNSGGILLPINETVFQL